MNIAMKKLGRDAVLAGAPAGRRVFASLTICATEGDPESPIYLDFDGVEVATASFLREAVMRFRDFAASLEPVRPVVVANASSVVLDELEFFVEATRDALWTCTLDSEEQASDLRLIGRLEPVEADTLNVVILLGEVSAKQLAAQQTDVQLTGTAWNNRLASLSNKGLLFTRREGRGKVYRSVRGMT